MNNVDYSSIIKDTVKPLVTYFGKKESSDKTFKAKVTEIVNEEKVRVLCYGNHYTVYSSIPCSIDNYVRVCAPCNNWNDLYVVENKSTGMTIRDLNESIKSAQLKIINMQRDIENMQSSLSSVNNSVIRLNSDSVKTYGASAKIGLNIQPTGFSLSVQREGSWLGYLPITGITAPNAVAFNQLQLVKNGSEYELHFYNADGTWICKK